ncbi:hypothetical protein BT96DRAFT_950036 [Gymnopus androsaceus JB14]|uniref:Uncharacterized protein n=1 Tax=Gymnopus androsaceus JB14 TaxID=1447944 RepID=A0A6A4GIG1_9AGAR|nr:hypothetical protein BT96DRAFT_950036 [Gymnopus androsaceus JB14]
MPTASKMTEPKAPPKKRTLEEPDSALSQRDPLSMLKVIPMATATLRKGDATLPQDGSTPVSALVKAHTKSAHAPASTPLLPPVPPPSLTPGLSEFLGIHVHYDFTYGADQGNPGQTEEGLISWMDKHCSSSNWSGCQRRQEPILPMNVNTSRMVTFRKTRSPLGLKCREHGDK